MDQRDGPPDREVVRKYQEAYGEDCAPFLRAVADELDPGDDDEPATFGELRNPEVHVVEPGWMSGSM